jgi:ABC-type sugar transport system permease subunit
MTTRTATGQPVSARRPSGMARARHRPQFWLGSISLLIAAAWYAIFVFRPAIRGFIMSALDYVVLDPGSSRFVGLHNFELLFGSQRFLTAALNTVLYTVLVYVFSVPISLLMAWCITNVVRGRRFYEFVVFLPVVVSLVAVSMLFRMLMNPDFGLFNTILYDLYLPTSKWIFGADSALYSVVLVDIWKGLGFYVILLTGAMLAVPADQQDAARVDGAGPWRVFRHVTIPSIMPTLALVSVFTVYNGLQVYVTPTVLGPGPGNSTLMVNQYIVDTAFLSFNLSLASAASVVLFVFVLILTVVQLRILRPRS